MALRCFLCPVKKGRLFLFLLHKFLGGNTAERAFLRGSISLVYISADDTDPFIHMGFLLI